MSLHVTEARDIKNTALNVIRCQTKKSKERSIDFRDSHSHRSQDTSDLI